MKKVAFMMKESYLDAKHNELRKRPPFDRHVRKTSTGRRVLMTCRIFASFCLKSKAAILPLHSIRSVPRCRSAILSCAAPRPQMLIREYSSSKETGDRKEESLSFDDELKQLSLLQRYKKLAKEYWYVLIPVHCCTSIFWFGSCLAIVYT